MPAEDNHDSKATAFRELSAKFSCEENSSKFFVKSQSIQIFYDTVHIVKYLRNILLCRKLILFPPLNCSDFCEPVIVAGEEVSWSLLHRVHEKIEKFFAKLCAAPHLPSKKFTSQSAWRNWEISCKIVCCPSFAFQEIFIRRAWSKALVLPVHSNYNKKIFVLMIQLTLQTFPHVVAAI